MKFTKRETGDGKSGKFLKVLDGESVIGVFRGEVYEYYQRWDGSKYHVCEAGHPDAKPRFRLNFITGRQGEEPVAKIFEFGVTIYNQLAQINEELPIETTKIKISRKGTKQDTEWFLMPLGPANVHAIESIKLLDLEHPSGISKAAPAHAEQQWDQGDDGWGEDPGF